MTTDLPISRAAAPTVQNLSDGNGNYYLVSNGPLAFKLYGSGSKQGAKVTSIKYDNQELVGSKGFYYDIQGSPGIYFGGGSTFGVRTGTDFVDISATNFANVTTPLEASLHWILRDGEAGFHTYLTYHHTAAMTAYSSSENRLGAEFFNGSLFKYSSITDDFWGYQDAGDPSRDQGRFITAETADVRGVPGEYIKNYETKYDWRSTYAQSGGVTGIFGAPNTTTSTKAILAANYGAWNIVNYRGYESWNAGPTHPQTPVADGASMIPSPAASHFGGPGLVYTGDMDKAFGPFYTYFNKGSDIKSLRADASKYATGDYLNNFYDSAALPFYATTAQRGTVSGKVRLADGQSMEGSTVVLSTFDSVKYNADPLSQEYQRRALGYNYWITPSKDGSFSLPDVRPGKYRVTIIKPGVYREGTFDNINVVAGSNTSTGNLTYAPDIAGKGVFQLGTFDRTAGEYKRGDEYNNWLDTFDYKRDFPNGVNYRVNPSNPFNDAANWRANWGLDQQNAGADFWKINFDVPFTMAANSTVTVTFAVAGQQFINDIAILVGKNRVDAGFDHTADNAPTVFRSGDTTSRVLYRKLTFPSSWLAATGNSFSLHVVGGDMQWDALRVDITKPGTFNTSQWIGAAGNWSDAAHWQTQNAGYTAVNKGTAALPNNTSTTFADGATSIAPINSGTLYYDAVLNGGLVNLDVSATVEKFSLLEGSLSVVSGTPTLTVNDTFAWGGGTFNGGGTINAALAATNVTFANTLSGGAKVVSGAAVTFGESGSVNITGPGSQWTTAGLKFGATSAGTLSIDNGGKFLAGAGSLTVGSLGNLNVGAGAISATHVFNAGSFSVAAAGSISLAAAGTFNNSGQARIDGAIAGGGINNTAGLLVLNGVNTYTGQTSVTGGGVQFGSLASIGGSGRSVNVGSGGAVAFSPGSTTAAFLDRIATGSTGAIALTSADASPSMNFTTGAMSFLSNMGIGAIGDVTYNGLYTPAGTTYRLGGGGGNLTYIPKITGATAVQIGNVGSSGSVVLDNTLNDYTGVTTINGGVLSVAVLANGGAASNIGASSNSQLNLILDGGTLRFTGAGGATNRNFTVGPNGGTIDGSGTAGLVFNNTGFILANSSGSRTLTLTGTHVLNNLAPSLGDPASGITSLLKTGPGTWTLSGTAKTYGGATTVNEGMLALAAPNLLPSGFILNTTTARGNLVVNAGGTVDFKGNDAAINGLDGAGSVTNSGIVKTLTIGNADASGSFAGVVSGAFNLVKVGTGTQVIAGDNTYAGTTTINAGVMQLGVGGTPSSFGPGDGGLKGKFGTGAIINNATLRFNRGYLTTVTNVISGPGTLQHTANAELILSAANTYTGPTVIGQGIANLGLGTASDGTGLAYSGDCSLAASLLANGGANSSIGASTNAASNLILDGGTLFYSGSAAVSTDRLFTVTQNGGAIYTHGALTFSNIGPLMMSGSGNRTLSLGGDSTSGSTFNSDIGDPVSGVTSLTKDRGAAWTIGVGSALTYSGDTNMLMGTLTLAAGVAIPSGVGKGNLVFGTQTDFGSDFPAKLQMNGNNLSVNAIQGGAIAYSFVDNSSGTRNLSVGATGASGSFAGAISGGINLIKLGAGVQTLTGISTFTGSTTVSQGALVVSGTGALPKNGSAGILIAPDPSGAFGNADDVKLIRSTALAATIDNWGSQSATSSFAAGFLTGSNIRIGSNVTNNAAISGGETVTMSWRLRSAGETPGTQTFPPSIPGSSGLVSDVINLTGFANAGATGSGQTDAFALQMTYDDRLFTTGVNAESVHALAGTIRLGGFNTLLNGGQWENAIIADFTTGATVISNFQGSWDSFAAAQGGITDANIFNFVGSYGVDTVSNTAWAVVDHTGQFAVVPEPSPVGIAISALGFTTLRRRRR